jgi:hypothetical protein
MRAFCQLLLVFISYYCRFHVLPLEPQEVPLKPFAISFTYGTNGRHEKFIRGFGQKTLRK